MSGTTELTAGRRRAVMACVILGVVLAALDSAIANIALPTLARDLRASDAATVWVVNIYQLATTICLLPAATMGERLGTRRIYGTGLVVFTAASLLCALSPTLPVLVGARLLQGIGGACIASLGPALIRVIYPREMLGKAFAMIAIAVAVGIATGPTIAALILSVASWPWLFLVNVPLGIGAVALFFTTAPDTAHRPIRFDLAGALLNAAGFGLLVIGVDALGSDARLASAELAAGLLCLAALAWLSARNPAPMLPVDLMRIPIFALSVGTSVCSYAAQILAYVSLPFLLETVMHRSTTATGFLVTPWPLTVALAAPFAGRLIGRYPAALLGSAGLAVFGAGLAALALLPADPAAGDIVWRMALCGLGFGFFQTPNNTTLMTSAPLERSSGASAMIAVARTVGWSIGSALVALVFQLRSMAAAPTACLWLAACIAAAGALFSVSRTRASRA